MKSAQLSLDIEQVSQHCLPDQETCEVGVVVISTVSRWLISSWNATNVTTNARHIRLATLATFVESLFRAAIDFDEYRSNSVDGGQTVKTFEQTSQDGPKNAGLKRGCLGTC